MRRRLGKFRCAAGKTFCGARTSKSGRTACWQLPPGVVFYGLLALFPAVTALVSLYGLFANASAVNDQLSSLSGILPSSALDILHEQIARLTSKGDTKLGFGFVVGLGVALWSANAGMKAIIDALNVVYEEKEKRGFIKLNLVSLAFTLAAIASLLLASGRCRGFAAPSEPTGPICASPTPFSVLRAGRFCSLWSSSA